ncbi:MAG: Dihydroorotate dehydrogenase 2 [Candidatus Falkowbacteria bacterium GW2011_GWA2_39_24]|uniref:Dihydroorotate dehydrogenase (quinone) n=1 Tax=Candidatus Falkowbacteria bacterium GW2011_GWA2_39_24 TaxID=1618634 RepID=A0A0G0NPU9_9BACT|nr:MAG: Dihydroorotate dehydrogenase 2 [Candidatus Falkowbacteria bacterium GW2011_GWA2_39_24]
MNNLIIAARNKSFHFLYVNLLKPIYFCFDPEKVHNNITQIGKFLGQYAITRKITSLSFSFTHPMLEQDILGIHFPNPVGLAAGFDKDALLTDILPCVGFGFAEVGSITGESCKGNPKPRLWRLKKSRALLVYYGLKNQGCEKIAHRLRSKNFRIPIGTSIAKTNSPATVETKAGIDDYLKAFRQFANTGHYFTINISCPNAFGGEPFTDPDRLNCLLSIIDSIPTKKPIFLKMSPDLNEEQVGAILRICEHHRIHGFICGNLTKNRDTLKIGDQMIPVKGGISGKPTEELSNAQIRFIYRKTSNKYIIIGCGGIFSAIDAYVKIRAGASLVELITGMIFEGPQLIGEINRGLVQLLKRDGFQNIQEARGTEKSTY